MSTIGISMIGVTILDGPYFLVGNAFFCALLCSGFIIALSALRGATMAARYSDKMMMMRSGKIIASGKPDDVLTGENLEAVYRIKARVKLSRNTPFVIPLTRISKKEQQK